MYLKSNYENDTLYIHISISSVSLCFILNLSMKFDIDIKIQSKLCHPSKMHRLVHESHVHEDTSPTINVQFHNLRVEWLFCKD